MEYTIKGLKEQAKAQLSGNIGMITLIAFVVGILLGVSNVLSIFLVGPVTLGMTNLYLGITYGEEPGFRYILDAFRVNFFKSLGLLLVQGIYVFLWSCLFIIPGIIKQYSYSMSFYILSENPDLSITECITYSRKMMDGHKLRLFLLNLSFILWYLLVVVTGGLASIYVAPFRMLSICNFYHHVKISPGTENYTETYTETY